MPVKTSKHCRHLPEPEDGTRILVMRFWPRGVPRGRVGTWMRQLAPSAPLLKAFHELAATPAPLGGGGQGPPAWLSLMDRYRGETQAQQAALVDLRRRHLGGEILTLLCGCHDPARCHRTVLASLILEAEPGDGVATASPVKTGRG